MKNMKQFYGLIYNITKTNNKYARQEPTTTTQLHAPDLRKGYKEFGQLSKYKWVYI